MRRHLWAAAIVGSLVLGTPGMASAQAPPVGQPAPDVAGRPWVNSAPLTTEALRYEEAEAMIQRLLREAP